MSRQDSESLRGGCCGSEKSGGSDVAKLPQRVDVKGVKGRGSAGLGDNKVEAVTVLPDVVEWDEELPDCCK